MTIDNKSFLCVGGAVSIDKMYRTPCVSWWPEEEITHHDVVRNWRVRKLQLRRQPARMPVVSQKPRQERRKLRLKPVLLPVRVQKRRLALSVPLERRNKPAWLLSAKPLLKLRPTRKLSLKSRVLLHRQLMPYLLKIAS